MIDSSCLDILTYVNPLLVYIVGSPFNFTELMSCTPITVLYTRDDLNLFYKYHVLAFPYSVLQQCNVSTVAELSLAENVVQCQRSCTCVCYIRKCVSKMPNQHPGGHMPSWTGGIRELVQLCPHTSNRVFVG